MGVMLLAVLTGSFCAAGGISTEVEDAAITARIETMFLLNEHLSPFNINTTTKEGHVTLTGSVHDDVQRNLAEDLARSAKGVKSVHNQITAIPTVVGEKERRGFRQKWNDKTISASVRARLLYHRQFRGLRIGVSTVNGVVTLHGVVGTAEQKKALGRVAADTRGVKRLVNNLTVSPRKKVDPVQNVGRQFSDEWIEGRVETSILLNKHLSIRALDVEVNDGICILTGTVNSEAKRTLAANIAGSIEGVDQVRNEIRVTGGTARPVQLETVEGPMDVGSE